MGSVRRDGTVDHRHPSGDLGTESLKGFLPFSVGSRKISDNVSVYELNSMTGAGLGPYVVSCRLWKNVIYG